MLLLHEFHERKFLLPDKLSGRERERQARAEHAALHGDGGDAFEEVKAGMYARSNPCCFGIKCSSNMYQEVGMHFMMMIRQVHGNNIVWTE